MVPPSVTLSDKNYFFFHFELDSRKIYIASADERKKGKEDERNFILSHLGRTDLNHH